MERTGKNVFWILFIMLAGIVPAQIVDPETAKEIARILTEIGPYG